jgi:hypothetical protein
MARKTHQQRVDEQEAKYRAQLEPHTWTNKELAEQAEQRAVAHQKAALIAEIRRQRAVGESLDLQAALDAARGGPLVLPAMIAQGDLGRVAMAEWLQNVTVLSDLARVAPDAELRMECADRAAQRTHDMLKLIAEKQPQGSSGRQFIDAPQDASAVSGLTREEKIALVRRQLKLAGGT